LFLIDQFGVLHNGIDPYPGAVDALQMLKANNKHVVVISNSGKRAQVNEHRLESFGFNSTLIDSVMTSGEVAFNRLQSRLDRSSKQSCYLIARDNDKSAIEGLELELVDDASNADIIIISASEAEKYSEEEYRTQLRTAAERNVTCLCTNPDKKMLTKSGLQFGAGRIAELYEWMGGTVEWIGKPYPAIYQEILKQYSDCELNRVLCIGDSAEHDIAGGQGVHLKTLLVMTGINIGLTDDALQSQFKRYQATPDYIAPAFKY